jgi:hypothetical protein
MLNDSTSLSSSWEASSLLTSFSVDAASMCDDVMFS